MTTKTNTPRPGDVPGSRDRSTVTEEQRTVISNMTATLLQDGLDDAIAALREPENLDDMPDEPAKVKAWPLDNGGTKHDQDKVRMDLFAPEMIEGVSTVLTIGAAKYGDRNWERGMDWSRPYGALMRHMFAWWRGEKTDPETGKSHLWHAGCCLMFLIAYEERGTGRDDRP